MKSDARYLIVLWHCYPHESTRAQSATLHVEYGDYEASVRIEDGEIMVGKLPPRALRLVNEWRELHRTELADNWSQIRAGQLPARIPPLT